jgi:hypothetical protein
MENSKKDVRTILKKILMISAALVGLEVLLQIGALYVWYMPRLRPSHTVLCIADYETNYPENLKHKLDSSPVGDLRIESVVHPNLTVRETIKIVDSYLKNEKPQVVYLTTGSNDLGWKVQETSIVWDNSFQWRFRSRRLIYAFRSGDFSKVFTSNQFHKVPSDSTISITTNEKERNSQTEKNPNSPNPQFAQANSESSSKFPTGTYDYYGLIFDFKKDGIVNLCSQPMNWMATGNHLSMSHDNQILNFAWEKNGSQLQLLADGWPGVMTLNPTTSSCREHISPRILRTIPQIWSSIQGDENNEAVQNLVRLLEEFPQSPAIHALEARVHLHRHEFHLLEEEVRILEGFYKTRQSQEAAEALFFSVAARPYEEINRLGQNLLRAYPKSPMLWGTLAEYSEAVGDKAQAASAKKKSMELMPEFLQKTRVLLYGDYREQAKNDQSVSEVMRFNLKKPQDRETRHTALKDLIVKTQMLCSKANVPLVFVLYPDMRKESLILLWVARQNRIPVLSPKDTPFSKSLGYAERQVENVSEAVFKDIQSRFVAQN